MFVVHSLRGYTAEGPDDPAWKQIAFCGSNTMMADNESQNMMVKNCKQWFDKGLIVGAGGV